MRSKAFWLDALERAAKTGAQAALGFLGVGSGMLGVDWVAALIAIAVAVLSSVATSILSAGIGEHGTPSVVGAIAGGAGPEIIAKLDDIADHLTAAATGRHSMDQAIRIDMMGGMSPEIVADQVARRAADESERFLARLGL